MKLLKSNWLVKVYKFNNHFTPEGDRPLKTSLCHFCRVVFIWLPLKLATLAAVGGGTSFGGFYFFFIIIPETSWILHWTAWGAITAGVIFCYLADNYRTPEQMVKAVINSLPAVPKWYDDLIDILEAWWFAIENKICPFIEIESDEDDVV